MHAQGAVRRFSVKLQRQMLQAAFGHIALTKAVPKTVNQGKNII